VRDLQRAARSGVRNQLRGVAVQDDSEPRPGRLLLDVQDLKVEQGVVGLPLLVGTGRGSAVIEALALRWPPPTTAYVHRIGDLARDRDLHVVSLRASCIGEDVVGRVA